MHHQQARIDWPILEDWRRAQAALPFNMDMQRRQQGQGCEGSHTHTRLTHIHTHTRTPWLACCIFHAVTCWEGEEGMGCMAACMQALGGRGGDGAHGCAHAGPVRAKKR
jgi:hypothetical protein